MPTDLRAVPDAERAARTSVTIAVERPFLRGLTRAAERPFQRARTSASHCPAREPATRTVMRPAYQPARRGAGDCFRPGRAATSASTVEGHRPTRSDARRVDRVPGRWHERRGRRPDSGPGARKAVHRAQVGAAQVRCGLLPRRRAPTGWRWPFWCSPCPLIAWRTVADAAMVPARRPGAAHPRRRAAAAARQPPAAVRGRPPPRWWSSPSVLGGYTRRRRPGHPGHRAGGGRGRRSPG